VSLRCEGEEQEDGRKIDLNQFLTLFSSSLHPYSVADDAYSYSSGRLVSQINISFHESCDRRGQHRNHIHQRECVRLSFMTTHERQRDIDFPEIALREDRSVAMVQDELGDMSWKFVRGETKDQLGSLLECVNGDIIAEGRRKGVDYEESKSKRVWELTSSSES
jgi:hypothetical protein